MQESCAVVILAAGSSNRMGGQDKLWCTISGRFVLAHTIEVFDTSPIIDAIVVVTNPNRLEEVTSFCVCQNWRKVVSVVAGGTSRQESSRLGLKALTDVAPDTKWVMVHDAARPLVTHSLLERGLETVKEHLAAVPIVAVKDTIKEVQHGQVQRTPDRSRLWAVQTPQIFSFPLICQAYHASVELEGATDDATIVERLGYHVATFPGSYTNIKITTPEDLLFIETLLTKEQIL